MGITPASGPSRGDSKKKKKKKINRTGVLQKLVCEGPEEKGKK